MPRPLQRELSIYSCPSRFVSHRVGPCPSSSIASSEGVEAILLAVCQSVEATEKEGFKGAPVDPYSEEEDNDAFLNQCSSDNESSSEERHSGNEDEWDDDNEDDNGQAAQASWMDSGANLLQSPQCPRITTCYGDPSLFQLYPYWW